MVSLAFVVFVYFDRESCFSYRTLNMIIFAYFYGYGVQYTESSILYSC